jgi:hypothetical protein
MLGRILALAIDADPPSEYMERVELTEDRDAENYDDSSDEDMEVPSSYIFETYLNKDLSRDDIDQKVIDRFGDWYCKEGYHNPLVRLVELLTEVTLYDEEKHKESEDQSCMFISPALLGSYLRILKIMLETIEEYRPNTTPHQFAMWCKIIPNQVVGDFAVYSDEYYEDLEEAEEFWEDIQDDWSDGENQDAFLKEEDFYSTTDEELDEQEEESDEESEEEDEADTEERVFASVEETEDHQCTIGKEVADRWLHVGINETDAVSILDQNWHDRVETEDSYVLANKSGIETIDVKSQTDECYDDELPPSIHLDIMRLLRRGGVISETPHAIAESLFCMQSYISEVIKKVILDKIANEEDGDIDEDDISKAVQDLQTFRPNVPYHVEFVEETQHDPETPDEPHELNEFTEMPLGIEPSTHPFSLLQDVRWDLTDVVAPDTEDIDLSFDCTMIPIPPSTLLDDMLSEQILRLCNYDVSVPSEFTKYLLGTQCVVALRSVIATRCDALDKDGVVDVQQLLGATEVVGADTFYDYLKYLITGDQEIIFEHEHADQLAILNEVFPLDTKNNVIQNGCCNFGSLIDDDRFNNFTIITSDGMLRTQKEILISRSSYFASMFGLGLSESTSNEVDFSETIQSLAVARSVVEYLYTDNVSLTIELAMELIPAANYLGLNRLSALCEVFMARNLCQDNAEAILHVALHFESKYLYELVESFIAYKNDVLHAEGSTWSEDEVQYFESLDQSINENNVTARLVTALQLLGKQELNAYILTRLDKHWKHQYVHYIARNYDLIKQEDRDRLAELSDVTLSEEPTNTTIIQKICALMDSWKLGNYDFTLEYLAEENIVALVE